MHSRTAQSASESAGSQRTLSLGLHGLRGDAILVQLAVVAVETALAPAPLPALQQRAPPCAAPARAAQRQLPRGRA